MLPIRGALVRNTHNPAVGPGRILGSDQHGRLTIGLLWQPETSYAIDPANASLERYILFGFAPVHFRVDDSEEFSTGHVIRRLDTDDKSLWRYELAVKNGDEWLKTSVKESELIPLPPASNYPIEHLRTLAWQSPKRFFSRWKMLLIESRWLQDSGGIPAFLGARINPMGYQLYAARRVLWDRVPRFILADEVGLGKTIEAGLIIQALKAEKPDLRVLVITPGSMARQWQTELYLRFGAQAYVHIDSSSLQNIPKADWKNVLKSPNLIVTATALQTFKEGRQILAGQRWDLVIIDEAHQFPPGTEFYSFLHILASTSHGLLALSATPSKREITSLAGLLALVSPEVYKPEDHESLLGRISLQREVWDRLNFTSKYLEAAHIEGTALDNEDFSYLAEQWEGLLPDDEIVSSLVSDIKGGRAAALDDLVAYVQEFHRLDHRIIRTRRITLEEAKHHWSERVFELIEYPPDSDEAVLANHLEDFSLLGEPDHAQLALRGLYSRVFNTTPSFLLAFLKERQKSLNRPADLTLLDPIGLLSADPGPADEELLIRQIVQTASPLPGEANWLDIALGLTENWKEQRPIPARTRAVCRWLRQHLDESPKHQVLLFAQDKAVVVELTRALQAILTDIPVKSFHHGISESELARVALQFQKNKDCRVLVSDELGGEGRNFQNASALIHFDLPWSVSRLEQRIGRLDRVGRGADRPVNSIVLCGPSPMEQAVLAVHSEVFKVLTQSVGGIEYALPRFQRNLNQAICRGTEHVRELTNSLTAQVEDELHNVDEAFELSLDASKLRLVEAQKLAEWLNEESDSKDEDQTLAGWAKRLGINTRKQRDDAWEFKWTIDELQRQVKTLRTNGFMTGTFERARALTDDTQQFFSPGHPLVNALISDLHGSAEGRATVMFLELGAKYRGRLFAVMICRCNLDNSVLQKLDLSPGLILRAERFLSPEIQPALFELHVDQTPSATLNSDSRLMAALRSPTDLSTHCKLVRPNELNEGLDNVRGLWASAEEAITLALEYVKELRKEITEKASDRLGEDLRSEISYLSWLQKRQSVEQAQQTILDIEARKVLIDSVRSEKINLEAVAIIVAS